MQLTENTQSRVKKMFHCLQIIAMCLHTNMALQTLDDRCLHIFC